jgi:glycosyltransferase involved in cell wall biosynthesis
MRILWTSNYSSFSGYSNQAQLFVPRIQAAGHHVVVFELANGKRRPRQIGNVHVLPGGLDPLGSDIIEAHTVQSRAHAVITLVDVWGMNKDVMKRTPWFPITPVDTLPIAPKVKDHLHSAIRPIAMSQYGVQELKKAGFEPLYIPHGVDPQVWHPQDKARARHELNIPQDTYFVSFVGVNDSIPSRKGLPELLMAWQVFSQEHPTARLYLHTTPTGNLPVNNAGGVDIPKIMDTLGIDKNTVQFPDAYRYANGIPAKHLAMIAAASDVLILPSRGEGFGLPALEFQRVGCPVILNNFTTGPELCFSGWLLEGEPEWSWQNASVQKPGILSIIEALGYALQERDNPARKAQAIARAQEYDIDWVMAKYALPVLQQIGEMVLDRVKVA